MFIWKDAQAFKIHIEEMRMFSTSHTMCAMNDRCPLAALLSNRSLLKAELHHGETRPAPADALATCPIWMIKVQPGWQN